MTTVNGNGGDDTSAVLRRRAATATNSSEDSVLPSPLNLVALTQYCSAVESSYLKHGSEHSQRKVRFSFKVFSPQINVTTIMACSCQYSATYLRRLGPSSQVFILFANQGGGLEVMKTNPYAHSAECHSAA
ncbi:uncharacterized protein LOC130749842 [Lotus japonicus]|uniref:uncharacterized protein LOC130749842 n=1 Tax=Lotus japonicus TaxID=34305 RepID=UPI00258C10DD|nr:uncharacterized protein LOC130749842 [Lotus japonicus]